MSAQTVLHSIVLETETCCNCGIVFAMPDYMRARRLADGEYFYCPNGHSQHYTKSEVQRLKDKLAEQTRVATEMAERAKQAEEAEQLESARRQKAEQTLQRVEKRIKAGVCPCCNRTFQQLARHIKTKHPELTQNQLTMKGT